MSLRVETRGLTKRFGTCVSVSDVSISFEPGLIHAVLGENGAGKSTLMKLLFGLLSPSEGEVLIDGSPVRFRNSMDAIRRGIGMVQQHFSLVDTLSAIDNIMLGAEPMAGFGRVDRAAAIQKIEKSLPSPSLRVPWETLVKDLTVGQKQRVEILKLLFRDARVLFLDEPTAVLTPSEVEDFFHVLRELKKQGRTVILITHKINEVLGVCDTYSILRQGQFMGSGQVAGASVDDIVEKMIGRRLQEFSVSRPVHRDEVAISCINLREDGESRGKLNGLNLDVRAGEIVGVAGVEGSGQSHFVEAIFGRRRFQGDVKLFNQSVGELQTSRVRSLGVGLVPEDRHHQGLWLEGDCHMNMVIGLEDRFVHAGVFDFAKLRSDTDEWAKSFDVRAPSMETVSGALSGGNQQKLIFAREVTGREPRLLVCHQPTRGVDLGAIDLIHRRLIELRNQGLAVLILSSELDELLKLCDRIYVFYEGRVAAEFARADFDRLKIGAAMTGATHVH